MPQTLPTLQALELAAQHPGAAKCQLQFAHAGLDVSFALRGGLVTSLSSPTLPDWASYLHSKGVSGQVFRALQDTPGPQPLLHGGYSEAQLRELCQERLLYAFLPLLEQHATLQLEPLTLPNTVTEHGDLAAALPQLQRLAAQSSVFERHLLPTLRLVANPLLETSLPTEQAQQVYSAALRGLSLGQISASLPLRWDKLTRTISLLLTHKALFGAEPTVQEHAPLGHQMAPDFCLPQLRGPDVRLSGERGHKVWLIFNRQATCGFCNPRHETLLPHAGALREGGVRVLSVWASELASLWNGIGQQAFPEPFSLLADPHRLVYARYGVKKQFGAGLDARNLAQLPLVARGLELVGARAFQLDGEGSRLPAEFLINAQGKIEVAHYNRYATDWLSTEQVLAWAKAGA